MDSTLDEDRNQTIPEEESTIQSHVNLDLLDDIPNLEDELLASIRKNSVAGSQDNRYTSNDGNRITQYTAGFPDEEDMSEIDKFNKRILQSTDWGINPPALKEKAEPKMALKPKISQHRMTHGNKVKLPRERPYVDQATQRTHDPPPRYGKTMYHGDENS